VVISDREIVGPLRLPEKRAEAFIDAFNRRYGRIGLSIRRLDDPHPPGVDRT
jgi:hypothetical protein